MCKITLDSRTCHLRLDDDEAAAGVALLMSARSFRERVFLELRKRRDQCTNSLTSHCFGELLDPQRRVNGVAFARVRVEDDEPVDALGADAVQDLVLEVAAKERN